MKPKQSYRDFFFHLENLDACWHFCAVLANSAFAQTGKGTLVGRAADTVGAVLPGAKVRVEPGDVSAATNQLGEFTVINLAPGDYKVTISYVGFLAVHNGCEGGRRPSHSRGCRA